MKNSEVYFLLKKGLIPEHLLNGWNKSRRFDDDMEPKASDSQMKYQVAAGWFATIISIITPVVISLDMFDRQQYHSYLNWKNCAVDVFIWCLFLIALSAFWRMERAKKSMFGVKLVRLYTFLATTLRDILTAEKQELIDRVNVRLIGRASMILYAEKTFGRDSESANKLREWFRECHKLCLAFGLAEAKFDTYYEQASLDHPILSPVNEGWIRELEHGKIITEL